MLSIDTGVYSPCVDLPIRQYPNMNILIGTTTVNLPNSLVNIISQKTARERRCKKGREREKIDYEKNRKMERKVKP